MSGQRARATRPTTTTGVAQSDYEFQIGCEDDPHSERLVERTIGF
jgi:hypothetical protein